MVSTTPLLYPLILVWKLAGAASTLPPPSADELGRAAEIFSGPAEVVADGSQYDFHWLESPVWSESGQYLLLSDVQWTRPDDGLVCGMIWKYDQATNNVTKFLECSGLAGPPGKDAVDGLPADIANRAEGGSNGLALLEDGTLLVNQHAWKRIISLQVGDVDTDTASVDPSKVTVLVDAYDGAPLNSPNDMVVVSTDDGGDVLYFTDPPFGLQYKNEDDPFAYSFELMTQDAPAVYKYTLHSEEQKDSDRESITRLLQFEVDEDWSHRSGPNGVAINKETGSLAVVITDWNDPRTEIYAQNPDDGSYDPQPKMILRHEHRIEGELSAYPALADGATYDADLGLLIVSGPGGIYLYEHVADDNYETLGFLRIDDLCSNNVIGGGYLWLTCNQRVLRVPLNDSWSEPSNPNETSTATTCKFRTHVWVRLSIAFCFAVFSAISLF